jgi:uncharacterized protein YehS (DUF1456 family)
MAIANNNDNLRRLRYALDLGDSTMLGIFAEAGVSMEPGRLASFFKREQDPGYAELSDELFGSFLDGLIAQRRGKREPAKAAAAGATPALPLPMTNNRVLRSIRIALELKDQDMIDIMALAGVRISKSELSALFRKADHKNYRECGDQFLRNFLQGLAVRRRG